MNKEIQPTRDDMSQLAEEARAPMAARADVAGKKAGETRKRLAKVLDRGKEAVVQLRKRTAQGAKVTDEAAHKYPYPIIAAGVVVGVIAGYALAKRSRRTAV